MSSVLSRYLEELSDPDKQLVTSKLVYLSLMNPAEVHAFAEAWCDIDAARRRDIVGRLVDLAEDNLQLDFEGVFRVCLKDPDEQVRTKALAGLADSEESGLIEPMIELLQKDPSDQVRAAAATALGSFVLLAELGKIRAGEAARLEAALLAVINKPGEDVEVRRRAIESISPLSKPVVKQIIREAYQSDNERLEVSAICAMGRNCDMVWLDSLAKELESPDAERRFEAAGACGELGEQEAVQYLRKVLNDTDIDVRMAAIEALGAIGGNEARQLLVRLNAHSDERIRQAARDALAVLETESEVLFEGPREEGEGDE